MTWDSAALKHFWTDKAFEAGDALFSLIHYIVQFGRAVLGNAVLQTSIQMWLMNESTSHIHCGQQRVSCHRVTGSEGWGDSASSVGACCTATLPVSRSHVKPTARWRPLPPPHGSPPYKDIKMCWVFALHPSTTVAGGAPWHGRDNPPSLTSWCVKECVCFPRALISSVCIHTQMQIDFC